MGKKILKSLLVFVLLTFIAGNGFAGEVEVMHWWTSGGEAKSVSFLKELLEKRGHTWKDMAVAGGGGGNAMTVLKSRAVSGNAPTAAQLKGPQIQQWGDIGVLTNLDDIAQKDEWDLLLPKVVANVMKYKGHYVAVPVNVHKTNWMWANPDVFRKSGAEIPTTWKGFEEAAEKIKKAGFIPVAWGGQNWQESTAFEAIVLGVGGANFYERALVKADPNALNSPTMVKCLDTLKTVLKYIDQDSPGRDWNLATSMVIQGKAAMQFMGDWAKGEFTAAGKSYGVDYIAMPVPESSEGFLFNVDSFIMFKQKKKSSQEAQADLAHLIMGEEFQRVFNINKGSIPCRLRMSRLPFDYPAICSFDSFVASAASDTLLPSMAHEMAVMPAIRGAIFDVITNFCDPKSKISSRIAAQSLAYEVEASM